MDTFFVVLAIVGLVLIAAEVLTGELSLLVSGSAVFLAGLAGWFLGPFAAVGVAGVVAVAGFGLFRPAMLKRMQVAPTLDNIAALPGSKATVLQRVDASAGLVKLAGSDWTARTEPWEDPIEVGAVARVVRIQGATAIVRVEHELEKYSN